MGSVSSRSADSSPRSLTSNMMWNSLGSLTYLVCSWLTTVLVVILAPDYTASGSLAVAMAVGNILATIVLFKVRPVQVADNGTFEAGDYVGFRILCVTAAWLFCMVYSALTVEPSEYAVVALFCIFKTGDSFVDVYHAVDQRHGRLDYAGISQILRGFLTLAGFVVGLMLFQSLTVAVGLMAVVTLAVVVVYDRPRASALEEIATHFKQTAMVRIACRCAPGFIASLLVTLVVSFVRQRFGAAYGTSLLGVYAAVATPTVVVQAFASYLYAPLYGPIASYWRRGDRLRVLRLIGVFCLAVLVFVGVLVIAAQLLGGPALQLVYGADIAAHAGLLPGILVCTALTAVINFLVDILIIIRGHVCAIVSSGMSCLLGFALAPFMLTPTDMNSISLVIVIAFSAGSIVALSYVIHAACAKRVTD